MTDCIFEKPLDGREKRILTGKATVRSAGTSLVPHVENGMASSVPSAKRVRQQEFALLLHELKNLKLSMDALLAEIASLVEQISNPVLERYLSTQLHQYAEKDTQPHLLTGVSPRETDVLRLVAQGKSNREIAEALVISERTVANHLANIFNKIGVENRAGAAAFAIRHNLVE